MRLAMEAYAKLSAVDDPWLLAFVEDMVALCQPAAVTVLGDSADDLEYIRKRVLEQKEEVFLEKWGHNYHHDHPEDRTTITPLFLTDAKKSGWWPGTCQVPRREGLSQAQEHMRGAMAGKEMFVCLYTLGPQFSTRAIPVVQVTDSAYAAHNGQILCRPGYTPGAWGKSRRDWISVVHSTGNLVQGRVQNPERRSIWVDTVENRVYVYGSQYVENSVGPRTVFGLVARRLRQEKGLAEKAFLAGISARQGTVYAALALLPEDTGNSLLFSKQVQPISADAVLMSLEEGSVMAVGAGRGVFGVLPEEDTPENHILFSAIESPREEVVSNQWMDAPEQLWFWLNSQKGDPPSGINYRAKWHVGQPGAEVGHTPQNADYALRVTELANADAAWNRMEGVKLDAIVYGCADPEDMPPIVEAFDWEHGVYLGACAERRGEAGMRHIPFSNGASIPLNVAEDIAERMQLAKRAENPPRVFLCNFFRQKGGALCHGLWHRELWARWMAERIDSGLKARKSPIGWLPQYSDLATLAKELGHAYSREEYNEQFSIRKQGLLQKEERMAEAFLPWEMSAAFCAQAKKQRQRLLELP